MKAYLQHRSLTLEGHKIHARKGDLSSWHFCNFRTESVPVKIAELPWQKNNGVAHGERVATKFMVKVNNVWRRVYMRSFSDSCTLFIGANPIDGVIVTINE